MYKNKNSPHGRRSLYRQTSPRLHVILCRRSRRATEMSRLSLFAAVSGHVRRHRQSQIRSLCQRHRSRSDNVVSRPQADLILCAVGESLCGQLKAAGSCHEVLSCDQSDKKSPLYTPIGLLPVLSSRRYHASHLSILGARPAPCFYRASGICTS